MNWQQIARAAARKYGMDEDVFVAQMGQEAGGRDVSSPAGAQGPAQIMPATAQAWGVKNPHDINQAYDAAAKHMADYTRQYGVKGALVAYNAGPGRVGKSLPSETQKYIDIILGGRSVPNTPASTRTGGSTPGAAPANSLAKMQAPQAPNYFQQIAKMTPVTVGGTNPLLQQIQQTTQKNWQMMGDLQSQMQAARTAVQQGGGGAGPQISRTAPKALMGMFEEAEKIDKAQLPYQWGGGHGATSGGSLTPLDCSGAVSRVLGIDPRVSGDFMNWGGAGRGKNITVYANKGHVLMEINGHFWGTSKSNPGGGAGWIDSKQISSGYLRGFVARHPQGM